MSAVIDVVITRTIRQESDYPQDLISKWDAVLKSMNDTILNRIKTKIPDVQTYQKVLATPSYEVYADFVNPQFRRADMIKLKQRVKVLARGEAYLEDVEKAFTKNESGVSPFMEAVDSKKDKLALAIRTLDVVGIRFEDDWSVEAIVGLITGDKRGELYLARKGITGTYTTLYDMFDESIITVVRPALIALLTEGGVFLAYAGVNGLDTEYSNIMSYINGALDKILALRDTTKYPTAYIHFEDPGEENRASKLQIHVHVETGSTSSTSSTGG